MRRLLMAGMVCALFALVTGAPGPAAAGPVTIDVGDRWFCDASFENGSCTTTVTVGDQVVWDFTPSVEAHTVTECGASCDNPTSNELFDSGVVQGGEGPFAFTFSDPGTYLYYCQVHAFEMRGQIVVQAGEATPTSPPGQPTATPVPGGPTSTPGATQAPVSGVPSAGHGPDAGGSSWLLLGVLGGTGLALSVAGATLYRTRSRSRALEM